ncbi:MAG: hypothetical protein WBD62_10810, partial [Anaerolineales bacterium]
FVRLVKPLRDAQEYAAGACKGPVTLDTAWVGWQHAKQVPPAFRPDVSLGEILIPHFIHRGDLESALQIFR